MASEERSADSPLITELLRNPRQFSFFQAVRLLEGQVSDGASVGNSGPADLETVRFRPNASLGFPIADLETVERLPANGDDRPRFRLTVNFVGLYGPVSPLPAFYTEEIVAGNDRESNRRDFFDLFHHRYGSLLYRSWEKYRYYLSYRPGGADDLSQRLFGLVGLDGATLGDGALLKRRERLLSSLGLLMLHGRSAATVERLIAHFFDGLPVRIRQFIERDAAIMPEQRARLGTANCRLGVDCTVGARVRDLGGKFRLAIGPLDLATFRRFLPDGQGHRWLGRLVPYLIKDPLDCDLELTLTAQEIPDLELAADNPCRLGWSSWLGPRDGGDRSVVLSLRPVSDGRGGDAASEAAA